MSVLIGVDPGARDTGIVAIFDDRQVTAATVHNDGPLLPLSRAYLRQIIDTIAELIEQAGGKYMCKVEGVVKPNWHVQKDAKRGAATNPEALIATAQALGAVMASFEVDIVPPGRNGSKPLGHYPPELVSDGERRKAGWETRVGTGKLRHQRSAWDVAHHDTTAKPARELSGTPSPFLETRPGK